jgi:hypothetical protein
LLILLQNLTKQLKKQACLTHQKKKRRVEWLDIFEENSTKAQTPKKSQIETTEKLAIDKNELYGLSEEEIELWKNN